MLSFEAISKSFGRFRTKSPSHESLKSTDSQSSEALHPDSGYSSQVSLAKATAEGARDARANIPSKVQRQGYQPKEMSKEAHEATIAKLEERPTDPVAIGMQRSLKNNLTHDFETNRTVLPRETHTELAQLHYDDAQAHLKNLQNATSKNNEETFRTQYNNSMEKYSNHLTASYKAPSVKDWPEAKEASPPVQSVDSRTVIKEEPQNANYYETPPQLGTKASPGWDAPFTSESALASSVNRADSEASTLSSNTTKAEPGMHTANDAPWARNDDFYPYSTGRDESLGYSTSTSSSVTHSSVNTSRHDVDQEADYDNWFNNSANQNDDLMGPIGGFKDMRPVQHAEPRVSNKEYSTDDLISRNKAGVQLSHEEHNHLVDHYDNVLRNPNSTDTELREAIKQKGYHQTEAYSAPSTEMLQRAQAARSLEIERNRIARRKDKAFYKQQEQSREDLSSEEIVAKKRAELQARIAAKRAQRNGTAPVETQVNHAAPPREQSLSKEQQEQLQEYARYERQHSFESEYSSSSSVTPSESSARYSTSSSATSPELDQDSWTAFLAKHDTQPSSPMNNNSTELSELQNARRATEGYEKDPHAWQQQQEAKRSELNSQKTAQYQQELINARKAEEARHTKTYQAYNPYQHQAEPGYGYTRSTPQHESARVWEETPDPQYKAHRNSSNLQHPQPRHAKAEPAEGEKVFAAGRIEISDMEANARLQEQAFDALNGRGF